MNILCSPRLPIKLRVKVAAPQLALVDRLQLIRTLWLRVRSRILTSGLLTSLGAPAIRT